MLSAVWREQDERCCWQVQTDGVYDCMSGAARLMSKVAVDRSILTRSQWLEGRNATRVRMKNVPFLIFAHSARPVCRCETSKDAQPDVVDQYSEKLRRLGLDKFTVQKELTAMRALQSKRAGVTGV